MKVAVVSTEGQGSRTQTIRIMESVAYERIKTEHAGAKNSSGAWMTRTDAKQTAKHQRRQADKKAELTEQEEGEEPAMAELPDGPLSSPQ
ncbi:MAG: hypothetical protein ACM3N0_01800 [Chloroflexota bacterium]